MNKLQAVLYLSLLCTNFIHTSHTLSPEGQKFDENLNKIKENFKKRDYIATQEEIAQLEQWLVYLQPSAPKETAINQTINTPQNPACIHKTSDQIAADFARECKRAQIKINIDEALAARKKSKIEGFTALYNIPKEAISEAPRLFTTIDEKAVPFPSKKNSKSIQRKK